ncbi:MAG: DUF438 domain-containing protein [SAR324 cluster bacterium]|nr:DUF438 domain-containing protein [SAR324 cluster bacterium]
MAESVNSPVERQAVRDRIIQDMHQSVPVDQLQKVFSQLVQAAPPKEIADMENILLAEDFPIERVQRLCSLHAHAFEQTFEDVSTDHLSVGHPLEPFIEENTEVRHLLKWLGKLVKRFSKGKIRENNLDEWTETLSSLREINEHHQRLENLLYPLLESSGLVNYTDSIRRKQEAVNQNLKNVLEALQDEDWPKLQKLFKNMALTIDKMIFFEEKVLFPMATQKLTESDWARIKQLGTEPNNPEP